MFTMMNNARLAVGMQGVAIAEPPGSKPSPMPGTHAKAARLERRGVRLSPIIDHPDVRRMLLTVKALTEGARAIAYSCAHATDMAHRAGEGSDKAFWQERAALLTPIAKSFDRHRRRCRLARRPGARRHGLHRGDRRRPFYRDARIAPIYEGTNGIQAIDLVGRKLSLTAGQSVTELTADIRATIGELDADPALASAADLLAKGADAVDAATAWLLAQKAAAPADVLAGAVPYLRLLGDVTGGWMLAKGALAAKRRLAAGDSDTAWLNGKIGLLGVYADNVLAQAPATLAAVKQGGEGLRALSADSLVA
jgi:hypothetical protein